MSLGNGKTNGVGDTLAEGTSGDLDTVGDDVLGVAGGLTGDLAETLKVVHRELVASEVEEDVLERTAGVASVPSLGGGGGAVC